MPIVCPEKWISVLVHDSVGFTGHSVTSEREESELHTSCSERACAHAPWLPVNYTLTRIFDTSNYYNIVDITCLMNVEYMKNALNNITYSVLFLTTNLMFSRTLVMISSHYFFTSMYSNCNL